MPRTPHRRGPINNVGPTDRRNKLIRPIDVPVVGQECSRRSLSARQYVAAATDPSLVGRVRSSPHFAFPGGAYPFLLSPSLGSVLRVPLD
eukprot:scaffold370532_cov28-Attheya_sp.AAC.1